MAEQLPGEDMALCVHAPGFVLDWTLTQPGHTLMQRSSACATSSSVIRTAWSRVAVLVIVLAALVQADARAAQLTFLWDYSASGAAGFVLYCGPSSLNYTT